MYHQQRYNHDGSAESSPRHPHHGLLPEEVFGVRKIKPLPKRRRTGTIGQPQPTTPANPNATNNAPQPQRAWSIAANFPTVERALNGSVTREQFMAHAGELAKRLTHQLQGRRMPPDRMELVQALLQQTAQHVGEATAGTSNTPSADGGEHGPGLRSMREMRRVLMSQVPTDEGVGEFEVPATPGEDEGEEIKFDLDAVFDTMAGFEAGLAGMGVSVEGFDAFGGVESVSGQDPWEEVAEFYYSQRGPLSSVHANPMTPPPHSPGGLPSDLGRRGARESEDDDEDDGDGDYHDQLRQPGNTKKRKVPANAGNSPLRGTGSGGGNVRVVDIYGDGERTSRFSTTSGTGMMSRGQDGGHGSVVSSERGHNGGFNGASSHSSATAALSTPNRQGTLSRLPLTALSTLAITSPSSQRVGQLEAIVKARGKLAGAMVAGLQHKELLKARKRQLAAVMGVLSHGDTLALDQALALVGNVGPASLGFPSNNPNPAAPAGRIGHAGERPGELKRRPSEDGREVGLEDVDLVMDDIPVRLSKRKNARVARAMQSMRALAGDERREGPSIPEQDFTFTVESATKERLVATKEEVTTLRNRFEAELERQAAAAAKLAAANKALAASASHTGHAPPGGSTQSKGTKPKKTKTVGASPVKSKTASATAASAPNKQNRPIQQAHQGQKSTLFQQAGQQQRQGAKQNQRTNDSAGSNSGGNAQANPGGSQPHMQQVQQSQSQSIPPPSKPKKKKRSALANASNPHHLRNYVPSRLPQSSGGHTPVAQGQASLQSAFGPLPLRFLAADLPPRRGNANDPGGKKKGGGSVNGTNAGNAAAGGGAAAEEWICAFCEYELFYGDEAAFKRAVRARKKILKRRRRARERAAAAANGVKSFGKNSNANAAAPAANAQGANGPEGEEDEFYAEDSEGDDAYDGDPGYDEGPHGNTAVGSVPKRQTQHRPGGPRKDGEPANVTSGG